MADFVDVQAVVDQAGVLRAAVLPSPESANAHRVDIQNGWMAVGELSLTTATRRIAEAFDTYREQCRRVADAAELLAMKAGVIDAVSAARMLQRSADGQGAE